ncbi:MULTISPECIES: hypothetical protein [unclassified Gordonia (in: high G+C Gram-positive bacteria)]|uniref:hypothetical protein n=1 Tax=unclassified Gordonia (in: high G+C Gram-positive bacteria) TaxID=2657482 RepID=UPI0010F806C1|nr:MULTISPECIES: hypothetical protein [unclassified Gordonia (in: high G+C Gram-positive bacteria)]
MDTRFFGPVTPFATIAASATSLLAYALLWGLGLVLGVLLFLFSAVGTYAHGITRQVCTGIAIGTLVVLGGFAIAVLFFADT